MNAALQREFDAKRPVFPMFEVSWVARGFAIETMRCSGGSAVLADGPTKGLVPSGGFKEILYGPGMAGNTLVAARTTVTVNDEGGRLIAMLDKYGPRGSNCTIRWVSPALAPSDWELLFTGVVDDWSAKDGKIEFKLKAKSKALDSPGPKPIFSRAEWGSAIDPSIWGKSLPLILGIHDSYKVTGRGMVPAINVKWNEDSQQFWFCASIGNLKSIPRIYLDGSVAEAGFTITRGVYGGVYQTIIQVDPSLIPTDSSGKKQQGQVLSFDCEGPDIDGGIGGTPITNPIVALRAYLNNYVFRDVRNGAFLGDVEQIHTDSWDAAEAFFDLHGYEGAFRIGGGDGERQPASTVIEDFLKAKPWVKMWWTPEGQIQILVLDPADPTIAASDWLNATIKVKADKFARTPGDRKDLVTGIVSPFLYSHSESKYISSYEAHDIGFVPEDDRVTAELDDPFSQGRYDLS